MITKIEIWYPVDIRILQIFCPAGGRKIQKFSGAEYPQTPLPLLSYDTTPNILSPTTIFHPSASYIHLYPQYSIGPFL